LIPLALLREVDIVSPGLMVETEGNTYRGSKLLVPRDDATPMVVTPEGVPEGTLIVTVAEVELTTLVLLTVRLVKVPVPAVTVSGAPNRAPASVTGVDPTTTNGGLTLVSAGSTLMEIE
jgi:hypothetical protein